MENNIINRSVFTGFMLLFSLISISAETPNNSVPVADAGDGQFSLIRKVVKLNASNSTDKDGNRLVYDWQIISKPKNSLIVLSNPTSITPELFIDQPGSYQIQLLVSDGKHLSVASVVEINTKQSKPIIAKIHDQKILTGTAANFYAGDSYDPDGDLITFKWLLSNKPDGSNTRLQNGTTDYVSIDTDKTGLYILSLDVSDGKSTVSQQTIKLFAVDRFKQTNKALGCVLDRIFFDGFDGLFVNSAPVADVGPDKLGVIGQNIPLDGSASFDIDLDTISYQWSLLSAPNGSTASISNDNQIMASLSPDLTGDYVAQLIVNDGCLDSDPDSALLTISVNQAPTINSPAITSAVEAHNYTYQVVATDPEGQLLSYALIASPAGMNIDENGLIDWTALAPASYPVSVEVSDPYAGSDNQNFDIIVSANSPPVIQSFPISDTEKDLLYSYQLTVTDADNDSINYQLNNPPIGMIIDTNGLILWTANTTGSFQINIDVDDGFGGSDTQSFTLEVIELPPNPIDIATPLSRTEYTPFGESVAFLYENDPPVQIGMPDGTISV